MSEERVQEYDPHKFDSPQDHYQEQIEALEKELAEVMDRHLSRTGMVVKTVKPFFHAKRRQTPYYTVRVLLR